jgi:hypothetical protein
MGVSFRSTIVSERKRPLKERVFGLFREAFQLLASADESIRVVDLALYQM